MQNNKPLNPFKNLKKNLQDGAEADLATNKDRIKALKYMIHFAVSTLAILIF